MEAPTERARHRASCALTGRRLAERVRAWRELDSARIRQEVSADRIVTVYRRDPETTARLEQLVDLEEDCCAGVLEFRLTYAARELVLLVRTAPGAEGSIDEILAKVTGSATGG